MWDYHSNTLLSKLFWRAIGLNASYYNRNTPHFPNHTSRAMKVFIHNWIQDERASRYCYKMRGLFVHKVVPKSSEKWTSHEANSKLFVNIFPSFESCKKYFNDNKHNSLRSTPKYARTFVLGIICPIKFLLCNVLKSQNLLELVCWTYWATGSQKQQIHQHCDDLEYQGNISQSDDHYI